jgi:hypothetical protein
MLELALNVALDSRQVLLMVSGDVETAAPLERSKYTAIRQHSGRRLDDSYEIADPCIGTKADNKVHVISQDRPSEHVHAGLLSRSCSNDPNLLRGDRIDARDAPPRVPGDMCMHLERTMSRHSLDEVL